MNNTQLIDLIISGSVPVVIAAEAKLTAIIPSWLKPIIAMLLGAAILLGQHLFAALPATFWTAGWGALLGAAGVGFREVLDQLFQQLGGKPSQASVTSVPPKTSGHIDRTLLCWIGCFTAAFLVTFGIAACNNITVQPGGPYASNIYLYVADEEITSSYQLVDTFLNWELTNRAQLEKLNPQIKVYADKVRGEAAQWFATAEALRDSYNAAQTLSNKNALISAVAVITTGLDQAVVYLSGTKLQREQLAQTQKIDPATIIQLVIAAFQLAEQDLPTVQAMFTSGQITVDQQNQLQATYQNLETKGDGQFAGPEWAVSP